MDALAICEAISRHTTPANPERSQIMGEFLHGWRRKAGCVTLVMACSFMTLCIRSTIVHDVFTLPITKLTTIYMLSEKRTFCFGISQRGSLRSIGWKSSPSGTSNFSTSFGYFTWYQSLLGVGLAGNYSWPRSFDREIDVPHFYVIIPLTAISAYLLLSNPRRPKVQTANTAAPAPADTQA